MSTLLAGTLSKFRLVGVAVRSGAVSAKNAILDLAFPPACRLCSRLVRPHHDFCQSCLAGLTVSEAEMRRGCRRCGFPLGRQSRLLESQENEEFADTNAAVDDPEAPPTGSRRCPQCKEKTFQFDRVVAMWRYHGLVCDAVVAAKYVSQSPLADALGRRLGDVLADQLAHDLPTLVTFVPSYFTRQWSRGGIGVHTIAAAAASTLGIPCIPLLRASRQIAKQAWLENEDRVHNVRDAFEIRKRYGALRSPDLTNQHILLVDDVFTTGATSNEVSGVLRQGGAPKVTVGVVARAVRAE
ncbi:phosphoribosyltransferase [Rhodopirellula maiorica SM1]|uniref:Phosphoribosyltransferase n=1 Tax=Rhodopirellula maiorica SM1 TaxID=1265738 RepID=M5RTF4_9BACT|nr:double zinc ribbon domain-containing protein [Rhodopirellula maiorica]EMI22623.1 phosphoribosyltransferase [Rhodopirellula maiorica SM1]